ncbi:MAG: TonB-dependent receptor [Gammaproteobacteria bacterium]
MNAPSEGARRPFVARHAAASLSAALSCSFCSLALAEAAAESAAQPAPHAFDQITINADRITPTAPGEEAARAEAARVPGGADVVSAADYANGRASTLVDVFAFAPGVFAQSRFGAEEARLSIRGSGLQRTFHMRGIYLMQDGVPITLADGSGDFQTVEPLALAFTEVRRGANALEYGGTTLGGSINFISPSGHDAEGVRPRIEGGSFGYRRALVTAGDVFTGGDYFASISAYEQDGFRDWSQQKGQRFFANAAFDLNDKAQTRFFVTALSSDSQLPGSITKAQLSANPQQANATSLAGRQERDYDLYRLANRTVIDLDTGLLELSAGYSYKDLFHPIFQVLQQRSNDYNASVRYVTAQSLGGHANRLVFGATPSWNRVTDDRFVNVAGARGAPTAASVQRSRNLTAFAEDQLDIQAGWTLVAGLQWTDSLRRYDDRFLTNGDQSLDASYARVSPKLGFLWQVARNWTVYGNLSDSFEPPSFGELTGGPGVDLLDAQTARTVELGTRGKAARVQWDISAYSARVHDELLGLNGPGGQPLGTVNAPHTLHQGLEAGAQIAITQSVSWRSSYLWSRFRFDGNASYGDNALPGIPEHFYRGELTWAPAQGYFVTLNTEWSPRRYAVDMAHTLFADPYALVGVKVGRNEVTGFSWFVEGRNLADRTYAATTGVIADAGGRDAAQFLPGDGRAIYAGLSWKPK